MPLTNNASALPYSKRNSVLGVRMAIGLLLALICFLPACAKNSAYNGERDLEAVLSAPATGTTKDGLIVSGGLGEKILLTAYSQVGTPYQFGGTSPDRGFDCSGFTRWVFAQNGIQLPRSSSEQFRIGRPVAKEDVRPGDLLIYKRYRNSSSTHVGIYVGDGRYIHSPSKGKTVMESDAFSGSAGVRFIGARRVFEDSASCTLTADQKNGAKNSYVADATDKEVKAVFTTPSTKNKTQAKNGSTKKSKKNKSTASKNKKSTKNKNTASKDKKSSKNKSASSTNKSGSKNKTVKS